MNAWFWLSTDACAFTEQHATDGQGGKIKRDLKPAKITLKCGKTKRAQLARGIQQGLGGERTRPRVHPIGALADWFLSPGFTSQCFACGTANVHFRRFQLRSSAFIRVHPQLNCIVAAYTFSRSQLHYIAGRNCVPELPLMNDGSPSPQGRGPG
jgi:hypothetical protein